MLWHDFCTHTHTHTHTHTNSKRQTKRIQLRTGDSLTKTRTNIRTQAAGNRENTVTYLTYRKFARKETERKQYLWIKQFRIIHTIRNFFKSHTYVKYFVLPQKMWNPGKKMTGMGLARVIGSCEDLRMRLSDVIIPCEDLRMDLFDVIIPCEDFRMDLSDAIILCEDLRMDLSDAITPCENLRILPARLFAAYTEQLLRIYILKLQ